MPEPDQSVLDETRHVIERGQAATLVVDELKAADLSSIAWSGSSAHIESVEAQLSRPASEVQYLCVRAPSGDPVAKAGIDYATHPGSGTIWQVAVHPSLQGLGLGARLIDAAEERIRARGLAIARIGVEDENDGARRLYERLGYSPCGRWSSSSRAIDEDGREYDHHGAGTDLSKELQARS
jgi:ribosomal protein S18 acetylase RimI-like enzyme